MAFDIISHVLFTLEILAVACSELLCIVLCITTDSKTKLKCLISYRKNYNSLFKLSHAKSR